MGKRMGICSLDYRNSQVVVCLWTHPMNVEILNAGAVLEVLFYDEQNRPQWALCELLQEHDGWVWMAQDGNTYPLELSNGRIRRPTKSYRKLERKA